MKKVVLSAFIFTFIFSSFAHATMAYRLGRGAEGLVTAPMEYMNQFLVSNDDSNIVVTATETVVGGTALTLKRVLNAAWDIVTFPFDLLPEENELFFDDHFETALDKYQKISGNSANQLVVI